MSYSISLAIMFIASKLFRNESSDWKEDEKPQTLSITAPRNFSSNDF